MRTVRWLALFVLGCAGPGLRGANSVEPENEPRTSVPTLFTSRGCRDASGALSPAPSLEFALYAASPEGPALLVERRPGHDSVVIANSYPERGAQMFAYVSSDAKQPPVLHRVRFASGTESELLLTRNFDTRDTPSGFVATPRDAALRCTLQASEGHADTAHTDAGG